MKKKKKDDCVSEIWFRKFYDPNDVGKKNYQCVRTERIEIKQFRQPERSDVDETLLSGFSNTGVILYQWQVLFV